MMTVLTSIRLLVSRRLAMSVMTARWRLMSKSGISANGIPKDRTIWEYTSAWVVLTARETDGKLRGVAARVQVPSLTHGEKPRSRMRARGLSVAVMLQRGGGGRPGS